MIEQLLETLRIQFKFPPETIDLLKQSMEFKRLKKGEFLLEEGQVCRHNDFIQKGMVMYYQLHDGEIIPCDFITEGNWVSYIKSFSTNTPSDMFIVALEEVEVYRISKSSLMTLQEQIPQMMQLQNHYIQQSFIANAQHATNLNKLSAKERYLKLVEIHPDWIQRVPQYYIAGYLGIKPQSLSRIKKEMSQ